MGESLVSQGISPFINLPHDTICNDAEDGLCEIYMMLQEETWAKMVIDESVVYNCKFTVESIRFYRLSVRIPTLPER